MAACVPSRGHKAISGQDVGHGNISPFSEAIEATLLSFTDYLRTNTKTLINFSNLNIA